MMFGKGDIFSFLALLIQRGSSFLLFFLLARILGAEKFGSLSYVYFLSAGLVGVFSEALSITYVQHYDKTDPARRHLLGVFARRYIALVAVLLSLSLFLWLYLKASQSVEFCLYASAVALSALLVAFSTSHSVVSRQGRTAAMTLAPGYLSVLIVVAFTAWSTESLRLTVLVHALSILAVAFIYYSVICKDKNSRLLFGGEGKHQAIGMSAAISRTIVSMVFSGPVHAICISILFLQDDGAIQVGVFNAFFVWFSVLTIVPNLLNVYAVRFIALSLREKEAVAGRGILYFGVVIFLSACGVAVLWLISPWLIKLYGESYLQYLDVLRLCLLVAFVWIQNIVSSQILYGLNRSHNVAVGSALHAASYLSLTVIFHFSGTLSAFRVFIALGSGAIVQMSYYLLLYFIAAGSGSEGVRRAAP